MAMKVVMRGHGAIKIKHGDSPADPKRGETIIEDYRRFDVQFTPREFPEVEITLDSGKTFYIEESEGDVDGIVISKQHRQARSRGAAVELDSFEIANKLFVS